MQPEEDWLSAERHESWYFRRKACDVIFIPEDGEVRIDEIVEKT